VEQGNLNRPELLAKVTEILAELVDNDKLQLTEETTADEVDNWDSINHVRLLIELERQFGFRFQTDEPAGLKNVGALLDLVQRKLR
jgi:acyl carrier protein